MYLGYCVLSGLRDIVVFFAMYNGSLVFNQHNYNIIIVKMEMLL